MSETRSRLSFAATCCALPLIAAVALPALARDPAPTPVPRLVFPPPPAEAVIEYLGALQKETDVTGKKKSLKRFLVGEEEREAALVAPTAVAIGPGGELYVVDPRLGGVVVMDRAAKRFELFKGQGGATLRQPVGVAVADDRTLYVSDGDAQAVYVFSGEGQFRAAWGGPKLFARPTALALAHDGKRLAVCDTRGDKVVILSTTDGSTLQVINESPADDPANAFKFPYTVAFDEEGFLYVADYLNYRIQIYDAAGDHDLSFGAAGDRPGNIGRPRGLAATAKDGVIFEVDGAFQLVQMFNLDGELLMWFGSPGEGPAQFSLPSGLTMRGDTIAVADTLNGRVQLYRYLGAPGTQAAK